MHAYDVSNFDSRVFSQNFVMVSLLVTDSLVFIALLWITAIYQRESSHSDKTPSYRTYCEYFCITLTPTFLANHSFRRIASFIFILVLMLSKAYY
jgi:hypothetical protein